MSACIGHLTRAFGRNLCHTTCLQLVTKTYLLNAIIKIVRVEGDRFHIARGYYKLRVVVLVNPGRGDVV